MVLDQRVGETSQGYLLTFNLKAHQVIITPKMGF